MVYHFWPIGDAVTKLMWCGQCEVTMAYTKFGVNMSKLCSDTASDTVWPQGGAAPKLFEFHQSMVPEMQTEFRNDTPMCS